MSHENCRLSVRRTVTDVSTKILLSRRCRDCHSPAVQSYIQHYTEPSTDPLPTNSTLSNTILPLGPGTFTHNSAGVPIIVACTKADLIDDGNDMAAGASGMGSMVKGKGGEWEERTDGVMQVLRTVCLKCES
jgi:dynein light intermediate chain 1